MTFIVDGIWGWAPRWDILRRKIADRVGPCVIWHYDNSGRTSLEKVGAALAEAVAQAGSPAALIGFSMGGLVIRDAVRQRPEIDVRRAIFFHTPHRGSVWANFLPLPATREMRPGSPFLRRLDQTPWTIPSLATWTPGDMMVMPGKSAAWSRASIVLRCDIPWHVWPVFAPDLHERAIAFLAEKSAPAREGRV
jgi:pimeloyl-ACP methyl ester carboxylesterase